MFFAPFFQKNQQRRYVVAVCTYFSAAVRRNIRAELCFLSTNSRYFNIKIRPFSWLLFRIYSNFFDQKQGVGNHCYNNAFRIHL